MARGENRFQRFFDIRAAKFLREGGLGRLLSLGILGVDKNNASHYFFRYPGFLHATIYLTCFSKLNFFPYRSFQYKATLYHWSRRVLQI